MVHAQYIYRPRTAGVCSKTRSDWKVLSTWRLQGPTVSRHVVCRQPYAAVPNDWQQAGDTLTQRAAAGSRNAPRDLLSSGGGCYFRRPAADASLTRTRVPSRLSQAGTPRKRLPGLLRSRHGAWSPCCCIPEAGVGGRRRAVSAIGDCTATTSRSPAEAPLGSREHVCGGEHCGRCAQKHPSLRESHLGTFQTRRSLRISSGSLGRRGSCHCCSFSATGSFFSRMVRSFLCPRG